CVAASRARDRAHRPAHRDDVRGRALIGKRAVPVSSHFSPTGAEEMSHSRNPAVGMMTNPLSIYLDALRFGAAFTVFVSHWAAARYSGGLSWRVMGYGRTSVIVPLRLRHRVGD